VTQAPVFPSVDARLLDDVVARIRRVGDPWRVVLFGSHAQGRGRPDSDLDLLIVEDSDLPRHRRAPRYLRALVGVFPAKDVIVWTPAEIADWAKVPHAFISTILREGVTLYER
jgi:predicted nucleotidyltransferase